MGPNLVDAGSDGHGAPRPYDRDVTTPAPPRKPAAYGVARLAVTSLAVLGVIALGIVAGRWQWERYETRADAVAAQRQAEDQPVVPLTDLLSPGAADAGSAQWRTATITGTLDQQSMVELRGRSVDNTATIQYVAWLRTADDQAVLVNLGWEPRSSASTPTLPRDEVTVTGVVRALEPVNNKPGTRIAPGHFVDPGAAVLPAYLMARSVCTADDCWDGLEPVPEPSLSLGPHVSYALQWWLLAVAAAPIAIGLTRRDARLERERLAGQPLNGAAGAAPDDHAPHHEAGTPDAEPAETAPPQRRRRTRGGGRLWGRQDGPSDEEIEDAL